MRDSLNSAGPLGDFLELLATDHLLDLHDQLAGREACKEGAEQSRAAIIDRIRRWVKEDPERNAILRIPCRLPSPRLQRGDTVFYGDLIRNSIDIVAEKACGETTNLLRFGRNDRIQLNHGVSILYFHEGEPHFPEILPPQLQWPCATVVDIQGDLDIPNDAMVIFEARELRIQGTLRMGARSCLVGLTPCLGTAFTLSADTFSGPGQEENTALITARGGGIPDGIRGQFQPRGDGGWTFPFVARDDVLNLRNGRDGNSFGEEDNFLLGSSGTDGFCGFQNQPAGDGQSFGEGQQGRIGGNGRRGRRGGLLTITFTAESSGHLLLDADGGHGGDGGDGAPGQSLFGGGGGNLPLSCFPGTPGRGGNVGRAGQGGRGGNAGRGGNGGEIRLSFVPTSDNVAFFPIRARACGGEAGQPGSGGRGGSSSPGRGGEYLTLAGNSLPAPGFLALDGLAGGDGPAGISGSGSTNGLNGFIRVNGVLQPGCDWRGGVGG